MLHKNLQFLGGSEKNAGRSALDLDSVLQTVADEFADLGHDVSYRGEEHLPVIGSVSDMQRIFNNLIENAVTYGKKVAIAVDRSAPAHIQIDVIDDGPGISDRDKSRVLEPFVRLKPERDLNEHAGFGLGLSIVNSLVKDAGGTFELLDRKPHGLIARVTLPGMM